MAALSSKSTQEISDLLDDYGIKHGPIVDSTRGLYEKKLREAMAKQTPAKPSSDKTYYREEREEVTYVHRRVPLRSEGYTDSGRSYMSSADYGESTDFRDSASNREPASYRDSGSYKDLGSYRDSPSYRDSASYREPADHGDSTGYRERASYKDSGTYREPADQRESTGYRERASYTDSTSYIEHDSHRRPMSYTQPASSREPASYREPEDDSRDQPNPYRSVASQRYVSQSKSSTASRATSSAAAKKEGDESSAGRLIPLWLQFLVFLLVAAFLYYVFTSMEAPVSNPFKQVEA